MKKRYLNDEEAGIIATLNGSSREEKIRILEASLADETDPINQRTLRSLISRLKGA